MSEKKLADVSTANAKRQRRQGEQAPQLTPALTIVSHTMTSRVGERLLLDTLAAGKQVGLSRNTPDFRRPGATLGTSLADPFLSRKPIVFSSSAQGGVRLDAAEGTQVVVGDKELHGPWEFTPAELSVGIPLELAERVVVLLHLAGSEAAGQADALGMVGTSPGLQRVRQHIEQVADLAVPVLIRGETGTGKEIIARAIHQHSSRREQPFVSVNLGAIPKELAAAELFGAKRGAYTGSTNERAGFFRAAHGGTLFLDEVGEAPPEVQVLLLRALETGEIYPVGTHSPVNTDVRLIAATDARLEEQIHAGRFKAPLLHRLAGYEIRIPPLRDRREDIGLLFHHFARQELEALGEGHRLKPEDPYTEPWLPAPLASRLVRYAWPGNIRQLRNVTRQLVIGSRGQPMVMLDPQLEQELDAAGPSLPGGSPSETPRHGTKAAPRRRPADISHEELLAALRECGWDLRPAADRLGIPRASIYDLIEKSPSLRTAGDLSVAELTACYRECGGDVDAMARRLEVSKRALLRRIKELELGTKGE